MKNMWKVVVRYGETAHDVALCTTRDKAIELIHNTPAFNYLVPIDTNVSFSILFVTVNRPLFNLATDIITGTYKKDPTTKKLQWEPDYHEIYWAQLKVGLNTMEEECNEAA